MTQRSAGLNRHRLADLGVLIALASLVTLYCIDAVQASRNIYNLIFVLPVSLLVLALCACQFVFAALKLSDESAPVEPITDVLPVMALFAGYVLTLNWVGFDVGTTLFLGVFLWMHGERRLIWLAAYSICFGFLISLFFSAMLPYPMPMLVIPTAY
ncbi:MAG: tripartite tricarboxylate transporter TctB family protein [Pseudomonadota bacterium]